MSMQKPARNGALFFAHVAGMSNLEALIWRNFLFEGGGEGEAAPEAVEEGGRLRRGAGGGAEEDLPGGGSGEGGGFGGDGDALFGAVGAVGQVSDGETGGGGGEDGAGRGHAVEEPEDFEFRFELVGDTVDDQIGLADGVCDGGHEFYIGQGVRAEYGTKCFLGVMEVARHHVLQEDGEAGAGGFKG